MLFIPPRYLAILNGWYCLTQKQVKSASQGIFEFRHNRLRTVFPVKQDTKKQVLFENSLGYKIIFFAKLSHLYGAVHL